jgi:hypothetical protein
VATAAVQDTISSRIVAAVPGVESVTTDVHGATVLTQLAGKSLDHVTVTMTGVPVSAGVRLASVVAELFDVSTSAPRVARSMRVTTTLSAAAIGQRLGDGWTVTTSTDGVHAKSTGLLPVEATVVPTVRNGKIVLDVSSVGIFGVTVDGNNIPSAVTDRLNQLTASMSTLPLGLTPTSATSTTAGVELIADATNVDLDHL